MSRRLEWELLFDVPQVVIEDMNENKDEGPYSDGSYSDRSCCDELSSDKSNNDKWSNDEYKRKPIISDSRSDDSSFYSPSPLEPIPYPSKIIGLFSDVDQLYTKSRSKEC